MIQEWQHAGCDSDQFMVFLGEETEFLEYLVFSDLVIDSSGQSREQKKLLRDDCASCAPLSSDGNLILVLLLAWYA